MPTTSDASGGADKGHEIPLREQLLVGVDNDAARHVEIRRERPGRREERAGGEPARIDRVPQLTFELESQRHAGSTCQRNGQIR